MVAICFSRSGGHLRPPALALLRSSLRRLQRIDRSRTRESTALSWRLLRFHNHDVPALWPRHAPFDHKQVLVLVDAQHPQVASRHLPVAHVPRHAYAFEHARWKRRGSNRTRNLKHRTVRLGTAAEMMPFHDALKALPLADSNDVDKLLAVENFDQHAIANLHRSITVTLSRRLNFKRHFAHELHRRQIILRQ